MSHILQQTMEGAGNPNGDGVLYHEVLMTLDSR